MKWTVENPAGLAAAMVTLGPQLLAQGVYVRSTAAKLAEPPGPRSGISGSGVPLRLLITGDSAGAGVGSPDLEQALLGQVRTPLSAHFELHWKLEASTGHTTLDAVTHLRELPPEPFDAVVTSLGTNDVTSMRMVSTWLEHLGRLVFLLRSKFQARQIIISGMARLQQFPAFPQPLAWYMGARARQFNRALRQWAAPQADCEIIPMDVEILPGMMAEDGFHPGPRVYALWGAAVAEAIRRRWSAA